MLGGRKVIAPLARRGCGLQIAMGAVMVVVALAMLGNYDIRFQNRIAADLPSFLVNPTEGLEETASAQAALAEIRGSSSHGIGAEGGAKAPQRRRGSAEAVDSRPAGPRPGTRIRRHPAVVQHPRRPAADHGGLRGRVVLVDFWTYSCINCLRTLPYLKAWDERYRKDGLTIVGVHTPEFPFEKEAGNVEDGDRAKTGSATRSPRTTNRGPGTPTATSTGRPSTSSTPEGNVRYAHFGEGEYEEKEEVIRELLAEAGSKVPGKETSVKAVEPSPTVTTPETYLGAARAERFTNPELSPGPARLPRPGGACR